MSSHEVERPYDQEDVERLRGTVHVEHTLARLGAERLRTLLASEDDGYTAVKHQHEVGAGYFEEVALAITGGDSETTALSGSTEESQFQAR
jgi:isocitrate lyase